MNEHVFKSGYIAFVGRPNVGKSTLLNYLVGQKVSITSRRPQTTRHCILGIRTRADAQLIFVDTPGIHESDKALNRYMMRAAQGALGYVDVAVFVVEAGFFGAEDERALALLRQFRRPVVLVINKVDKVQDKKTLIPFIEKMSLQYPFQDIVPVTAKQKKYIESLEAVLVRHLPAGSPFFGEDEITDKPLRFMAAEFVREQIFRSLGQELPYAATVAIDEFKEEESLTRVQATIYVERPGQKGIIIGNNGQRLKQIGQGARQELEKLLNTKVYLGLWVKVKSDWSSDLNALRSLGYREES